MIKEFCRACTRFSAQIFSYGNILMFVDEQGRDVCEKECMAVESIADGRSRSMEVYARHKDGYRMPGLVRTSPIRNLNG